MSKTFKKLFSLVLAGCMTVGMCVSASAATIQPMYEIDNFSNWAYYDGSDSEGLVMNVLTWSTTTNANGNKVTLYTEQRDYYDPAQTFAVSFHVSDGAPRMYSELGYNSLSRRGYTLNYDSTTNGKCTMWYDYTSNKNDSEIDIHTISNQDLTYRIYMPYRNKYLNAPTVVNGAQLQWTPSNSTIWHAGA